VMCLVLSVQCVTLLDTPLLLTDCFHRCRADLACDIALEATSTVSIEQNGRREIDIKRYAKVEKVRISQILRQFNVP